MPYFANLDVGGQAMTTLFNDKEILKKTFDLLGNGYTDTFVSLLHGDLEWTVFGITPYSGTFNSKDKLLNGLTKRVELKLKTPE